MIIRAKVLSALRRLEDIVRRTVFNIKPSINLYDSVQYARVTKVNFQGGKVDERAKGYSVEVEILTGDLKVNSDWPRINDVPIDPASFGSDGVVYTVPAQGAIVRLGFMYHNPGFPYIAAITSEGKTLPKGAAEEFRVQIGDIILQITKDTLIFKTKNYNTDIEILIDKILSHTHLGNSGVPTSPTTGSLPPGLTLSTDFNQGGL